MNKNNVIQVFYDGKVVGQLAMRGHSTSFEYDDDWIKTGFPISPFSLPLEKQVFTPTKPYFNGLFGAFADSLPDAWGQLLLNRMLKKYKQNLDDITVLDRLAIIGDSGMGALSYHPKISFPQEHLNDDLDELASQCHKILNMEYSEKLDELYHLGGTSGGARPKIMTEIDGEPWIIKFPAHVDGKDAGKMEYDYAVCAKACKITMSEFCLFPSSCCPGYFGTKRFDRKSDKQGTKRIHMLTAAALLELDFRQPSLDYHSLMKLTKILTQNNYSDIENLFRRMCFNVYVHNRDDHSKNFSFLYDDTTDLWHLSPAYDLTFSSTYYGEHTTTVDGNGRNPGKKELVQVGITAGIPRKTCINIAEEIEQIVHDMLEAYLQ